MRSNKKTVLFSITMIIGMLIVSEFTLQVLSWVFPKAKDILSRTQQPLEETVKDERLGWRGNPKHPDHDQSGFRNKFVPNEVSIVALGDSQTYGSGVSPDQAWPQQLESVGKIKTYNMGISGYSPPQSLLLLEEAINLKPKLIIEAFYTGNDLYESYSLIYHHKMKLPELENANESITKTVVDIENNSSLEKQIESLYKTGHLIPGNIGSHDPKHGFREFFAEHSDLYGVLRAMRNVYNLYKYKKYQSYAVTDLDWETLKKNTSGIKEYYDILENGKFKTVFTPNIRLLTLNIHDKRIAEGHRICLETFKLMRKRCKAVNIDFLVLIIPTKELVFKDLVYNDQGNIPKVYKNVIENEELIQEKSKNFLRDQKIYSVDALPVLRESIQNGDQPYPISWDGHPNLIGHRAIAALVLSKVIGRSNEEWFLNRNHR